MQNTCDYCIYTEEKPRLWQCKTYRLSGTSWSQPHSSKRTSQKLLWTKPTDVKALPGGLFRSVKISISDSMPVWHHLQIWLDLWALAVFDTNDKIYMTNYSAHQPICSSCFAEDRAQSSFLFLTIAGVPGQSSRAAWSDMCYAACWSCQCCCKGPIPKPGVHMWWHSWRLLCPEPTLLENAEGTVNWARVYIARVHVQRARGFCLLQSLIEMGHGLICLPCLHEPVCHTRFHLQRQLCCISPQSCLLSDIMALDWISI